MNKGLKNYTKQYTHKLGDVTTSVNLFKNDANMHIIAPLISTTGVSQFSTSLIYNHQDKDEAGIFGKGFKLNFFAKKTGSSPNIQIKNADGSVDDYTFDTWNKETQTKAILQSDGGYSISSHVELIDRDGNKKIYGALTEYPCQISMKSGDIIDLDFISSTKTIKNRKGDVIYFTPDETGKIGNIEYRADGIKQGTVTLTYSGDKLDSLEYKTAKDELVSKIEIKYDESSITIKDAMFKHCNEIAFEDGVVTKISDYYEGSDTDDALNTEIVYGENMATVTEWNNEFVQYFFDNEGIPLYQLDSEHCVTETEYDRDSKVLLAQSAPFRIKGGMKNYFAGMSADNFSLRDVTKTKVNDLDAKWKEILGDTVYEYKHEGSGRGTIIFEVPIDCIATDNVTAIIWGRQKYNHSSNSRVYADMQIGDWDQDEFKKPIADNNFEAMLLGATCTKTATSVRFYIALIGDVTIELGDIQIVKKDFGTFYEYDGNNNVTLISKCGENAKMSYSQGSTPKQVTGFDSSIQEFEHNDKGYPTKSTSAYGINILNEYDPKHPSLVTKQTLQNEGGDKIIETRKEYSPSGRYVEKEYDELENCVATNDYVGGKLVSITNALKAITGFEYDKDLVSKMFLKKSETESDELASATYVYNDLRQLTSVVLKNGSKYEFAYDAKGNISEVKINGVVAFSYTYDGKTGNVLTQRQGAKGDMYKFEYNRQNLLKEVVYIPNSNEEAKSLRYSYEYNDKKQLIRIKDGQGKTLCAYTYDDDDNVKTITANEKHAIGYSYDNLGNVNSVARHIEDRSIYESHENVSRSQSVHPKNMLNRLMENGAHACLFEGSAKVANGESTCALINEAGFSYGKEAALPYIDLKANQTLGYRLTDSSVGNYELGCVKFWFKPTNTAAKQYVFGVQSEDGRSHYSAYIQNNKLVLEIKEKDSNSRVLLRTNSNVKNDLWNYFALNFYLRDDGEGYSPNCEISLTLNSETKFYTSTTSLLHIDVGPNPVYYIGHRYDGNGECAFEGKISCLAISPRCYCSQSQIKRFYNITKDYIENCQYINSAAQTYDISETVVFTPSKVTDQLFDVFPLHNSVKSLKGTRPTKYERRDGVPEDTDKSFTFNSKIGRYAYVADGAELAYKFGQNGSGAIVMRVYTDADSIDQYLLDGKDSSGNTLMFYRNSDKRLVVKHNGTVYRTNFTVNNETWCTVGLSFEKSIPSSYWSLGSSGQIRVCCDGKFQTFTVDTMDFDDIEFAVGRRFDAIYSRNCTGDYYECTPFNGQIEMLCASDTYCSETTIKNLIQEIDCLTKTTEFDDFGMVKQSRIIQSGREVLTKTTDYAKRKDTRYCSQRIEKEVFNIKDTTFDREYIYGVFGNVTEIKDSLFGNHSYEYDERGFLTRDDDIIYKYDGNGNVKFAGDVEFMYDDQICDRLKSVGGKEITYSESNPLNPKAYRDKEFTFEGRRLVSYTNGDNIFHYNYNSQGLRIKKYSDAGSEINYIYDGHLLITEISKDIRLDYLYDDDGELFGFVKNLSENFYYVRDCFNNIIGIIDGDGNLVVKYSYNAWGKILDITGKLASTIGVYNSFRYKGYYYDAESGMYYCHNRYFVPEWSRWLNEDNIVFLEKETAINNLFLYCENNPIMMSDIDGNFALTLSFSAWLLASVFAVSLVAIESTTHVIQNSVSSIISGLSHHSSSSWNNSDIRDGINDLTAVKDVTASTQDPYGRAGQKKQGRELKNKSRGKDSWVPRNGYRRGPKPPKKHTPGRDHRKYLLLFAVKRVYDLLEELDMDRS